MTNRVFIISDTHFGHAKILEFEKEHRPFSTIQEHDEELINRWNSVVKKNDTVWHLGDVLFGKHSFEVLSRLNGIKKLVLGNHDAYPIERYARHFTQIYGSVKFKDYLFSHVPIHESQFYRFKGNVHGHLHSSIIEDERYINVSAEQLNLTPKLLDEVLNV